MRGRAPFWTGAVGVTRWIHAEARSRGEGLREYYPLSNGEALAEADSVRFVALCAHLCAATGVAVQKDSHRATKAQRAKVSAPRRLPGACCALRARAPRASAPPREPIQRFNAGNTEGLA